MDFCQTHRVFQLTTPLGPNTLLFYRMEAAEALGELFEYRIDALSADESIRPEQMLGQPVTVSMELPQGRYRYFNGFVSSFGYQGAVDHLARYQLIVRPWLWFLSRNSDCRIFQNQTVPTIVKEVFRGHGKLHFEERLSETYLPREYCVQYRESDYQFVSRLLQDEGIYYFFRHDRDSHTLILADSPAAHKPVQDFEQIHYRGVRDDRNEDYGLIEDWTFSNEVQSGAYAATNFDFTKPKADLSVKSTIRREHPHSEYELFDYPEAHCHCDHGSTIARRRIEEQHARYSISRGSTTARGLTCGSVFELKDFPRADCDRRYLVTSSRLELRSNKYETTSGNTAGIDTFRGSFTALDADTVFRPQRSTPKPVVQGPQTAVVVGRPGEEIWTDEHGQVKVKFHWDRYGRADETASCWVRVSQPWAGQGWGAVSIPRIGQEGIVDFLEGDPDRPIITGRVYNGDSRAPFALPGGATVSGIKSSTHKGAGYNEMSMDDSAGKEKINIHGQHDMATTVKNDQTNTIANNRTTTVQNGNDALSVATGNRTVNVQGHHTRNVVAGDDTVAIAAGRRHVQVKQDATLQVQNGSRFVQVDSGHYSLTAKKSAAFKGETEGVTIQGDTKGVSIVGNGQGVSILGNGDGVSIKGTSTGVGILGYGEGTYVFGQPGVTVKGEASIGLDAPEITITGGNSVSISAKEISISAPEITLSTPDGSSSITINASGVTIQGVLAYIN
ncbi:MAG: type VI secretion system tip protein VgrG [Methylococcaceae bacterium]|nr:type VI secretion system tip protein VgrG [Methylococcaceae bacterium]